MAPEPTLAEAVIAFLARERGIRAGEILLADRLEEDLGMTGDDASEFLDAFARRFAVDLLDLDFHKHFWPEGFHPFWLFSPPDWLKDHGSYPLDVAHLIAVAAAGRWSCPPRRPPYTRSPLWDPELDN